MRRVASTRLLRKVVSQPAIYLFRRHGFGVQIALHQIAAQVTQELMLLWGFYTFRDHAQAQAVRQVDDSGGNRAIFFLGADLPDK